MIFIGRCIEIKEYLTFTKRDEFMKNAKKIYQSDLFAGYKVITKLGTKLSPEHKHQIQQIAILLNAYESFK